MSELKTEISVKAEGKAGNDGNISSFTSWTYSSIALIYYLYCYIIWYYILLSFIGQEFLEWVKGGVYLLGMYYVTMYLYLYISLDLLNLLNLLNYISFIFTARFYFVIA